MNAYKSYHFYILDALRIAERVEREAYADLMEQADEAAAGRDYIKAGMLQDKAYEAEAEAVCYQDARLAIEREHEAETDAVLNELYDILNEMTA